MTRVATWIAWIAGIALIPVAIDRWVHWLNP